ncbi:uncharacterized protein LOC108226164 isoform X1 [Daucus carota subsp. sativus]|uniref:uncharacterized protein LOC108226164 isoform X1 n=1 Tax=Daucus carota subsp. sativus TaxID=79200 RepID=UPI0007B2C3EC|nr:PREDICTED: uncharacterized protein LOC108226164 isoform X1 [Daucus carota subsp. sativus]XP_017256604.1 PREDICTED: uncharacterized protein LOC108226164 isoform X1 [Daucus carota subsp. sativus]XP_017256607.1 PREDICTED: uncharacterized protein LOC108226164 isoform X1 [Daucus carota subsp. sativus]XP_017256613.1 PREDICTED: uncharacterized protein LOC108226164 isoform X1 [Daucus carota subsp. sativus]XP_017256620.1 PREDICTED: uncharacterized protein LOC108226164 isoform X1 [Daucus carota subsp.
MGHSIGSGRMASVARLLMPESILQSVTENVENNKLAAQYAHRELCEADEANLLDEDDMIIFGLNPTTDPLNLVCCNACKKPVRANQFAAHAELCRTFSSVEEIVPVPKPNNGTRRKRPPKERKKSLKGSTVQPTLTREREASETIGSLGTAPLSSHLNEQMRLTSSSPNEAKGNAPFVDGLSMMDSSGINASFMDRAAGAEEPPKKRSKLLAADSQLISDHLGTAKGVTKKLFLNTQEAFTCDNRNGSKIGSGKASEHADNQIPRQVYNSHSPTIGVPAPLATKMYYCQRNQRIRSSISDLYKASTDECWSDFG